MFSIVSVPLSGRFGVRILIRTKIFLLSKLTDQLWGSPNFLFKGYQGSFSGLKRPGFKVNP